MSAPYSAQAIGTAGSGPDAQRSETTQTLSQDTLVAYLLASKRSLSSINHVWRANEIVTASRSALEASAVCRARAGFLRRGVLGQLKVLDAVQKGAHGVALEAANDFQNVLRSLDAADARLQQTLAQLTSTQVEPAFRAPEDEPKSLRDFVDEKGVERLTEAIRSSIDRTNEAQAGFTNLIDEFASDLHQVRTTLDTQTKSQPLLDTNTSLPTLMHSLESHAKETADLLESLVLHFDLCVAAIKHTEGGGATAQSITGDLPEGMNIGKDDAPPEPMSEEERQEMLEVLEKDAAEVDDVVSEVRERLAEMESQFESVSAILTLLETDYNGVAVAFHTLEELGSRATDFIQYSQDFLSRWIEEKQQIEERMEELEGLGDFYEEFLRAYDGLLIEVGRRRGVQNNMEAIVRDAMAKIERLYEEDIVEREKFRRDQGDYLPSDIWPGLGNPPLRFEISQTNPEVGIVPDLPKKVLESALRRTGA